MPLAGPPNPLKLGMKVKRFFLDRDMIQKRVSKNRIKLLKKAGAYVRSDARRSIRPRKKRSLHSQPGNPPFSHDYPQHRLKLIFFVYDTTSESVVVGPIFLAKKGNTTVPAVHEHGQRTVVSLRNHKPGRALTPRARRAFLRKFGRKGVFRKTATYTRKAVRFPKRPFMGPAYDKNKEEILDMWRDALLKP